MNKDKTFSQLEARYKQPFARWSSATWENLVVKVVPNLTIQLKAQIDDRQASLVIEAYLDLVAQGIGRGHFFPHVQNEFPNFFIFSWETLLLPWILKPTTAIEKIETMAKLWNLAISLNQHPPWIERILISKLTEKSQLSDITDQLKNIDSMLFQIQGLPIAPDSDPTLLSYKSVKFPRSPYFLPETINFEAPSLLSVSGVKLDNKQTPSETFFVLLRPDISVFAQNKDSQYNLSQDKFTKFRPLADTVSKLIGLEISNFAVSNSHMAIVYKGSQRLHLWAMP